MQLHSEVTALRNREQHCPEKAPCGDTTGCHPNKLGLFFECTTLGKRQRPFRQEIKIRGRENTRQFTCEHKPMLPRDPTKQWKNLIPSEMFWNKKISIIFSILREDSGKCVMFKIIYLQTGGKEWEEWHNRVATFSFCFAHHWANMVYLPG